MLNLIAFKIAEILTNKISGVQIYPATPEVSTIQSEMITIEFAKNENSYQDVLRNKRLITFNINCFAAKTNPIEWETKTRELIWKIMDAIEGNPTLDGTVAWAGEIKEGEIKTKMNERVNLPCYQGKLTCVINCPVRNS